MGYSPIYVSIYVDHAISEFVGHNNKVEGYAGHSIASSRASFAGQASAELPDNTCSAATHRVVIPTNP